jgi:replicative DNA helicase
MLASCARIDLRKIREGKLGKSDWDKLNEAAALISEKPIYIDDTARLTADEIRDKAKEVKKHKDIKCLVIDYLQMMRLKRSAYMNEKAIMEISMNLKILAKELNIPVILLAQLNLDLVGEKKKRCQPRIDDLGEAIILDRFADVLMLINRESYYSLNLPTNKNAEIMIVRNRNGPTGEVALKFYCKFARFTEPTKKLVEET